MSGSISNTNAAGLPKHLSPASTSGGGGTATPATGTDQTTGSAPAGAQGSGAQGTGAAGPTPAAGGATAPANPLAAIGSLPTWLGPLAIVGGGGMAISGAVRGAKMAAAGTKGGGLILTIGGIAAALAGVFITYAVSKTNGAKAQEATDKAGLDGYNTQITAKVKQMQDSYEAKIAQLQQSGGTAPGAGSSATGPGSTATSPGATNGSGTSQTGATTSEIPNNALVDTPAKAVPSGTLANGAWNPSALTGTSVQLAAGSGASGTQIAGAGTFIFQTPVGDVNGYATAAEANDAVKRAIDTSSRGVPYLRFAVVQHGGRFYGALAKATEGQAAKPLDSATGTLVAWHATQYISTNTSGSWQVYSHDTSMSPTDSAVDVGYTTEPFAAGARGTAATGTAPATTTGPSPSTNTGTAVVGGGATTATTTPVAATTTLFEPTSIIGTTFSITAASTAEKDVIRGGSLQINGFVTSSTGGFGTAEDAAVAARAQRATIGNDPWKRVVTMQGSDGRFYVYTGSIVNRATAQPTNASPVHVFGTGFAEYFDSPSAAWKAIRDNT